MECGEERQISPVTDIQQEVIEQLKAKCYRLKLSNDCLLKVIRDLTYLLYDKFRKEDERN